MKKISLSFTCLCLNVLSFGTEITHYLPSNGLAGIEVTSICENGDFIWFATNDGLSRFDGQNFKIFRTDGYSHSLSSNNTESLMSDRVGNLWVGLKSGGVDIFNPRDKSFHKLSEYIIETPNRVLCIYQDSFDNIWLGTWNEGLWQLKPSGLQKPFSYDIIKHYPNQIVSSLWEIKAGKMWIGTYNGVFLYDIQSQKEIETGENHYAVTQFLGDTQNESSLWFSTWEDGLCRVDWDDEYHFSFTSDYLHNDEAIYRMACYGGGLLLGTWGNGLKYLDLADGNFLLKDPPVDIPVCLSCFKDSSGRFWLGTYGSGLYCIKNTPKGITDIHPEVFVDKSVYCLCELDSDNILIGTQGNGLYSLNIPSNNIEHVDCSSDNSFFSQCITSIYVDEEVILVGNDNKGLIYARRNPNGPVTWKHYQGNNTSLGKITSIYRTESGILWLGTKQNGVYSLQYDRDCDTFSSLRFYPQFGENEIYEIISAGDGNLWIATHKGMFLFDPVTESVTLSDSPHMILSVVKSPDGTSLWVGTSSGIFEYDCLTNKTFDRAPFAEAIPNCSISDLCVDKDGSLWFTAHNRAFRYIKSSGVLEHVDLRHQKSEQYFTSLISSSKTGRIYFGGTSNLISIDIGQAMSREVEAKFVMTEIQLDHQTVEVGEEIHGRIVLKESPEYIKDLTVPRQCKWLALSFADVSGDYTQNGYEYKLNGYSNEWQYLDISKPLSFSKLPPGEYVISVRLAPVLNSDDIEPLWSMNINITKPWWKTWLFRIIVVLVMFCLVFLILNIEEIKIKERQKVELNKEKENFFTQLTHDIMTPLSLILAPVDDLIREDETTEDQKEKLSIIKKNANYLSNVLGSFLDFKKTEIDENKVDIRQIEMISFVKMVTGAFHYLACSKSISLSFLSTEDKLLILIDAVRLERVLYNIIGNAIKYTGDNGKIEVSVKRSVDGGQIVIEVSDNGIGISEQNQKKVFDKFFRADNKSNYEGIGIGLYTSKRFMTMIGGDITIESELGKGTKISLLLPSSIETELQEEGPAKTDGSEFSVLVVEDNDQLRNYLRDKLSKYFQVAVASDGVEAYEYIRNNLPEIVITDVMMPNMDGIELCRRIKTNDNYSDIFVTLLSARNAIEDQIAGYESGADFYITKPFDPDILVRQVSNVFSTKKSHDLLGLKETRLNTPQSKFTTHALEIVEDNISNESFSIEAFASQMNMSKAVLYRKFQLYTNDSPNNFIKKIRLEHAAQMLKSTDNYVSEVAYLCGFSQVHYFIKCFKESFGVTPKSYRETKLNQ